jgi:hypothetical protein
LAAAPAAAYRQLKPKRHYPMNLNEVRDYTARVIKALHLAGWHTEGFALGNDLNSIGYQPLPKDYLMVLDDAERLAEQLLANGCPAPVL